MRIYLPSTVPLLKEWVASGSAIPQGPAYAVTPSLREWYREGDIDELEHAASLLAASASLGLLAADRDAPPRRAVLAVDVDESLVTPDQMERGALHLREPVPSARWASALVDAPDAESVIATVVGLLRDPSAAADDVDFALGEAEAADLSWYAVQELRYLD